MFKNTTTQAAMFLTFFFFLFPCLPAFTAGITCEPGDIFKKVGWDSNNNVAKYNWTHVDHPIGVHCTTVELVDSIDDAGASSVAESLCHNVRTRKVIMTFNNITDEGAFAIAKLLETDTPLISLFLNDNEMTDVGVAAIATSLKYNTHLQYINLSRNRIGDEGAKKLEDMMSVNTVIKSVWVFENPNMSPEMMNRVHHLANESRVITKKSVLEKILECWPF